MKKVQLVVELEIDDSQRDIDIILAEMDYNFSYKSDWTGQIGKEMILNTEILERIS